MDIKKSRLPILAGVIIGITVASLLGINYVINKIAKDSQKVMASYEKALDDSLEAADAEDGVKPETDGLDDAVDKDPKGLPTTFNPKPQMGVPGTGIGDGLKNRFPPAPGGGPRRGPSAGQMPNGFPGMNGGPPPGGRPMMGPPMNQGGGPPPYGPGMQPPGGQQPYTPPQYPPMRQPTVEEQEEMMRQMEEMYGPPPSYDGYDDYYDPEEDDYEGHNASPASNQALSDTNAPAMVNDPQGSIHSYEVEDPYLDEDF